MDALTKGALFLFGLSAFLSWAFRKLAIKKQYSEKLSQAQKLIVSIILSLIFVILPFMYEDNMIVMILFGIPSIVFIFTIFGIK